MDRESSFQSRCQGGVKRNSMLLVQGNEDLDHKSNNNPSDQEEEEFQRQHPFEYEREDSILPPGSPIARMMPLPRSLLQAPKTPSSDISPPQTQRPTTQQTSTPLRSSTHSSHQRYRPYQIPNQGLPSTPGRDFTPLALRRNHRQHKQRTVYIYSIRLLTR